MKKKNSKAEQKRLSAVRCSVRGIFVWKTSGLLYTDQIIKRLLFCWRQYQGSVCRSCVLFFRLRFSECRIFFAELDYIRRRCLCSMKFFMHPEEAEFYFRIWGFSLHKPDYMFKVFDKFHRICWPNDPDQRPGAENH